MKIYSFPFALTLESKLTIAEIELLQSNNPRALALIESTPDGGEYEIFRLGFAKIDYGTVDANGIIFVGETEDGKAGLSILLPASLSKAEKEEYINKKLSSISRNVAIVEDNAKKALVDVEAAKKSFLKSIVALTPMNEPKSVDELIESAPAKKGGKK